MVIAFQESAPKEHSILSFMADLQITILVLFSLRLEQIYVASFFFALFFSRIIFKNCGVENNL
jgi:hypothetical protein